MKGYKVLSPLRHNGERYYLGDFLSESAITEKESARLLKLGIVTSVIKEDAIVTPTVKDLDETNVLEEEPIEKTLDLNFELDELKDGAKQQGLEWKGNISKSNIIALIVENDKTAYFLDQLED
ncbi:hypothetical protein U1P98_23190 [Lysinibacillus irui]|uniref:Rho termination factor N-terminal domain-containing protein n=1 Tax=Lysinibacillus irui TaxID=2998077 RepID=A0ABU5NTA1_9BACI|nr:hypothetical protein [Lysinibacillus irui]MEA0556462.1 hypothetical protein [Lysinibacillus irui]MEA0565318.1 hypothetical protein [Lysinibacillus irui]MEA0979189.1 hypothetical protein [Lysinibacillus irui]MEA1045343.1 hypothetical protein [Lysinibacillus irui]